MWNFTKWVEEVEIHRDEASIAQERYKAARSQGSKSLTQKTIQNYFPTFYFITVGDILVGFNDFKCVPTSWIPRGTCAITICFLLSEWYGGLSPQEQVAQKDCQIKVEEIPKLKDV